MDVRSRVEDSFLLFLNLDTNCQRYDVHETRTRSYIVRVSTWLKISHRARYTCTPDFARWRRRTSTSFESSIAKHQTLIAGT